MGTRRYLQDLKARELAIFDLEARGMSRAQAEVALVWAQLSDDRETYSYRFDLPNHIRMFAEYPVRVPFRFDSEAPTMVLAAEVPGEA